MPRYNTRFTLSLADLELIEAALRLSVTVDRPDRIDAKAASELLGRLHDQKIFFRPKDGVYISG